ncbi:hypothetical protein LCGC14_1407140 [marine sediment metagenome]|uniref:Uncharacterized protein n=1 Tax=marine sediment metagenome TaxID=412755 RepID=A0A0F9JVE4_9ZZZZ
MHEMSSNLPTWAWQLGYRLEGDLGTVGDLYMYRDGEVVQVWRHPKEAPGMIDIEEIIKKIEYARASKGACSEYPYTQS